jgi:hypothetical protein
MTPTRPTAIPWVVAMLVVLAPGAARAQSGAAVGPGLRAWRPVVSLAGTWLGAQALGRVDATTRRASIGATTPALFALFSTDSTLGGAAGGEVAITVPVTRHWAVSVRGATARPTLTTAITADAEGAPNVEVTEQVADYTVDVAVLYQLPRVGGRRARPYLTVGGGYLRQLHEDNTLVETGRTWHGGAGLRWWLRGGDRSARPVGLTGELRWVWRTDGITFADGARTAPAAVVAVFMGF